MQDSGVIRDKHDKDDCTKQNAYHSISQLYCIGKVDDEVVFELLSEEAKLRGQLSDGQFGNRNGWSTIDTADIIVAKPHAARTIGGITGVLVTVIKAAFRNVAQGRLC
jgi:hypothetical protein